MDKKSEPHDLITAVRELVFQNEEKGKRAAELVIANDELLFQNEEKEKRAAELVIANEELVFQNEEKGRRALELLIANEQLVFQNEERGRRAAELIIANEELAFQNEEKGKRAAELISVNKELLAFTYISSHDLQEPLRKIRNFSSLILDKEKQNLSEQGKYHFERILSAAEKMQQLIEDLLGYSRINASERKFVMTDLNIIIEEVKKDLKETIEAKKAIIEITEICPASIIPFQFRQLMHNLIGNALKFSKPGIPPHILVSSKVINSRLLDNPLLLPGKEYCHITITDNGIGFDPKFKERIFQVFQKLHGNDEFEGTGIGLAIVKKIVENHSGIITATSEVNMGAKFDIYLPVN